MLGRYFGSLLSLLSLGSRITVTTTTADPRPSLFPTFLDLGNRAPSPGRPGHRYPHSSTRQRARYRRQIEAGQLQMERV